MKPAKWQRVEQTRLIEDSYSASWFYKGTSWDADSAAVIRRLS